MFRKSKYSIILVLLQGFYYIISNFSEVPIVGSVLDTRLAGTDSKYNLDMLQFVSARASEKNSY